MFKDLKPPTKPTKTRILNKSTLAKSVRTLQTKPVRAGAWI